MRPVEVVMMHPRYKLFGTMRRGGIAVRIGPLTQQCLDEPLGLAIGSGRIGPSA